MQVGLGCMRLSTAEDRDELRARQVIEGALSAGVRLFDTAPSYGRGEHELGHNELLLARALAPHKDLHPDIVVVTKAGLTRRGTTWVPDGRRKAIEASAQASAERLGAPLDVLLLHTIDPAVPLATSVRALEALRVEGLARAIGISNVTRTQLEEALSLAELTYLEVAFSVFDDGAERSGVLALAEERGLIVLAHTPLGGPKGARRLSRVPVLAELAARHGASAAQVALAYVGARGLVALVGATREASIRELGTLPSLSRQEREAIAARDQPGAHAQSSSVEVVLLVGTQGAGKTTATQEFEAAGYLVLSRDARGGTLSGLAKELAARLAGSASSEAPLTGVVIDGTYGTRAQRAEIVRVARRAGAKVRAVSFEVALPVAQANVVRRIVRALGRLPTPEELRRSKDPRVVPPRALFQYARAFEPLADDEGFASIEKRVFSRRAEGTRSGLAIAAAAFADGAEVDRELAESKPDRVLVYGWAPSTKEEDALRARVEARLNPSARIALCPHGEGPPICWCRPPLPGLVAAWIEEEDIDVTRSRLLGASRIDRTLAAAVGLPLREPASP
jgi:aryl-alcohol dehydrogenase-like predicted oxidoreductase